MRGDGSTGAATAVPARERREASPEPNRRDAAPNPHVAANPHATAIKGDVSKESAPNRSAPNGSAPNGSALDGSALDGSALDGSALDGSALDGSALDGSALDGSALDGSALDGSALDGSALDGSALDGSALDGSALDGSALDGSALDGSALDGSALDGSALDGEAGGHAPEEIVSNEEIVARLFDAFSRRDLPNMLGLLHPEVVFEPMTATVTRAGEPYCGHEGIRCYAEDVELHWQELILHPTQIRSAGRAVVALGVVSGRGPGGSFEGAPTTWVVKFKEGLVAHVQIFSDARNVQEALVAEGR